MRALIIARALTNSQPTRQPTTYPWSLARRPHGLAVTIRRPFLPAYRQSCRGAQGVYPYPDRARRQSAGDSGHSQADLA